MIPYNFTLTFLYLHYFRNILHIHNLKSFAKFLPVYKSTNLPALEKIRYIVHNMKYNDTNKVMFYKG